MTRQHQQACLQGRSSAATGNIAVKRTSFILLTLALGLGLGLGLSRASRSAWNSAFAKRIATCLCCLPCMPGIAWGSMQHCIAHSGLHEVIKTANLEFAVSPAFQVQCLIHPA